MTDDETKRYWRDCARTAMGAIVQNPTLMQAIDRQCGTAAAMGVAELAFRQADAMLTMMAELEKRQDATVVTLN